MNEQLNPLVDTIAARLAAQDASLAAFGSVVSDRLQSLAESIGQVRSFAETWTSFPVWQYAEQQGFTGQIIDSAGRHRNYVNGKQVAGVDQPAATHAPAAPDVHADYLAGVPEEQHEAARSFIGKAVLAVQSTLTEWMAKSFQFFTQDVIDNADDFSRVYYAKNSAGVNQDPIANSTGLSAPAFAGLAAKVITRGLSWVQSRRGKTVNNAEGSRRLAAELACELIGTINKSVGLDLPAPTPDVLLGYPVRTFSEDRPAPVVKPPIVNVDMRPVAVAIAEIGRRIAQSNTDVIAAIQLLAESMAGRSLIPVTDDRPPRKFTIHHGDAVSTIHEEE